MSNKRKFDEADVVEVKVKKHTLDSDEEDDDENEKYGVLHDDDIEGQEEGDVGFDGEIKITPFNMKEELEEGHFDTQGNYYNKKEDEIKDNWLDNIDWVKIKAREEWEVDDSDKDGSSGDETSHLPVSSHVIYNQMIELMQPKETVARALKRLAGTTSQIQSASSRWRKPKPGQKAAAQTNQTNSEGDSKKFSRLTDLADQLVRQGKMDTYGDTYEQLTFRIKEHGAASTSAANAEDDDDMFADSFEAKQPEKKEEKSESANHKSTTDDPVDSSQVQWEFKWENVDGSEVHGPHTSSQMQKWVEEGFFADGVFVRKCRDGDAAFYTSNRIDFDLYV